MGSKSKKQKILFGQWSNYPDSKHSEFKFDLQGEMNDVSITKRSETQIKGYDLYLLI